MTQTPVTRLRQTLFKLLQDDDRTTVLEQAVGVLICVSIVLAILATEPAIRAHHLYLLQSLDLGLAICFLIEYIARLWVAPLDPSNRKGEHPIDKVAFWRVAWTVCALKRLGLR